MISLRFFVPFVLALSILLLPSCESDYIPKPNGYLRIDLAPANYVQYEETCPFTFAYHDQSFIEPGKQNCWFNIEYPKHNATIHMSYKTAGDELGQFIEDSRTLAYKHTVKASAIDEIIVSNDVAKVYGLIYELQGQAASPIQFYLTDSVSHFLRGALYFNVKTNPDSLAPVVEYIKRDIDYFIRSLKWKTE